MKSFLHSNVCVSVYYIIRIGIRIFNEILEQIIITIIAIYENWKIHLAYGTIVLGAMNKMRKLS